MFKLYFKGIIIGVANIMPGVSGGTMAVVLGIYDQLLHALSNFFSEKKEQKIKHLKFLFPILLGAFTGIILFSKILLYCYTHYPTITGLFFIALIIPSIYLIIKDEKLTFSKGISFILGFGLTLLFVYFNLKTNKDIQPQLEITFSLFYGVKLLLSGFVAAGAMIIPGISGSLLLLMLGEYHRILFYINNSLESVVLFFNKSDLSFIQVIFSSSFLNLYAFIIGIILGILLFSKFISYMLSKYRGLTVYFIDGIILMSLIQLIINIC